ncbi:MAG: GNAT family N-acetyltransferase [Erysipelotrichaceae bacterium]|nr:GNAT family N-acetyltransferase [Erysipelotrichaceae bacterium]
MKTIIKSFYELNIDELYEILKLRAEVFVIEQNCIYPDIDDKDKHSLHVFLKEQDEIVAYLRVIEKGISFDEVSIGRVIAKYRRQGLGTLVLKAGIQAAKEIYQAEKIIIEAQTYAKTFYEKQGFIQTSDEFLEDGIPHIQMTFAK